MRALLGMLASAVILSMMVCPASTWAATGDVATTRTYLEVNYGFVQLVASRIKEIEQVLRAEQSRVRQECPAAAAHSPQDAQSTQLSNEVIGALAESVVPLLVHPAALRFLLVAGGLSWSDGALTHAVHSYVGKLETMAILGVPSICEDVRAWGASGYTTLPVSTVTFDTKFMPNWVSAGELPAGLARYETPSERGLLVRTRHLEAEISDLEAREVETWGHIMDTLELWP